MSHVFNSSTLHNIYLYFSHLSPLFIMNYRMQTINAICDIVHWDKQSKCIACKATPDVLVVSMLELLRDAVIKESETKANVISPPTGTNFELFMLSISLWFNVIFFLLVQEGVTKPLIATTTIAMTTPHPQHPNNTIVPKQCRCSICLQWQCSYSFSFAY